MIGILGGARAQEKVGEEAEKSKRPANRVVSIAGGLSVCGLTSRWSRRRL
jgi:hypothetical protein